MIESDSPSDGNQRLGLRGPLFWLKAARAPFFTGSLAPILVGTAAAFYRTGSMSWLRAALALLAIFFLHAGANLANDYYDHLSGNDEINVTRAAPFTGGSRFIQEGWARPREILAASLLSIGLGALIGLYFVSLLGWPILLLGLFGAATGFFYTASPVQLGYRGLGEIVIFLDFGLLPVLGADYVQTGTFSAAAAVGGSVVGLLMTNVLWINQFQDAEADAAVGKRHWVVRLGPRSSAAIHAALFAAAYAIIAAAIAAGTLPAWSSLAFLSSPLALLAAAVSLRHHNHLDRLRPANIATIAAHLTTAILLAIGLALAR
ncbi:MAG TPA: 1,4-dihydroxy-2-naphthoate octaprenyltransferase [Armatimonadota bacterium]|nr:1,4-dihydroxy-2-naphthoate octaprenyltransferase [Armatimonadota bacterium]